MKRNVGPEYGVEGEFYVKDDDKGVTHRNDPPSTQPSLWCQWISNELGTEIEWDGNEKFYNYVEWLQYIINWLTPRGYVLNGEVQWRGEDFNDIGTIIVENNVLRTTSQTY